MPGREEVYSSVPISYDQWGNVGASPSVGGGTPAAATSQYLEDLKKLKAMGSGIQFDPVTGMPIMPAGYKAQIPKAITGFDIAGGPIQAGYLRPSASISKDIEAYLAKGMAPAQEEFKQAGGLYGKAESGLEALKRMGESTDLTPYAKAQMQRQALEQSRGTDLAQRQLAQQSAAQQQQLMMRGGLGGGARERLAGFATQAGLGALQDVAGRGEMARSGIEASDVGYRQNIMGQLPGQYQSLAGARGQMGVAQGQLGQQGAQILGGAKQFDVSTEAQRQRDTANQAMQAGLANLGYMTQKGQIETGEKGKEYADLMDRYNKILSLFGTSQTADYFRKNPGMISGV